MQSSVGHWRVFAFVLALAICANLTIRFLQTDQNRLQPDREKHLEQFPTPSEFYTQSLDCGGISIRAHRVVAYAALQIACGEVHVMLRHIPDVRANLIAAGVEVHIVGRKQMLTDLPEFIGLKGKRDGDREFDKERGISGVTVVCPEENLLRLPEDPYFSLHSEACVHEFAHAIQLEGIPKYLQDLVERRFKWALQNHLWEDTYASTNELEFFAETSTWYFVGAAGSFPAKGWNGILPMYDLNGLMVYDPPTFTLLHDIYEGRLEIGKFAYSQAKRIAPQPVGRSANRAPDGLLVFSNQTASSLKLYLISPDGEPRLWGNIIPYERRAVQSSIGYRWLLSNDRDKPLDIFVPQTQYSYASIE